jgi:hypothetical protein
MRPYYLIALALVGCGGGSTESPVTTPPAVEPRIIAVLEPNLSASEIEAMKRQVPDPYPANDSFWRDKSGGFLNIYYHLYRPEKYKSTSIDFGSVSCKGSAALKAMLLDTNVGFYVSGDSIIAGGGVSSPERSYIRMMMSDLPGRAFELAVFPGRSLRNYLNDPTSGIYHDDLTDQIVIFAWGMNDHVYKDPNQFGADFRTFVSEAKARGAKHVIAFSTIYPDPIWVVSDYGTIDAQNRALVASDFVTPVSVTAFTDPRSPYAMLSEVNHPSDVGHMAHYVCLSQLYR